MKYIIQLFLCLLIPASTIAQHKLVLKSGETMNGEVVSINDGKLSFSFKGNIMNFKISEVASIAFLDAAAPSTAVAPSSTKTTTAGGTKGVSYVMNGRKLVTQPVVNNLTAEKGIVVVEITINKYGNVIKAEPGAEGTTTTSQYLLTKAKQAAESAHFDTFQTAPLEQKGTLTIIF